jgi:hypothetical protein
MDVAWRRSRIVVEPQGGFRQGTAYQVTLLPGLADLRGNRLTTPYSWTFATGANVPTGRVTGQIFDWQTEMVAPGAIVFAISRVSERDSIVYVGAADSLGRFSVGPLPPGQYDVVGFVDANGNRRRDAREKWSGVVQASAEDSPAPIELLAIERDTVAPAIIGLQFLDSVSIQVSFDRPIDPVQTLQPVLVRIQRADSTEIEVAAVIAEPQDRAQRLAAVARARADSIAAADSVRAAADTTRAAAPPPPPPPPPAQPLPADTRPKPRMPAPYTAIVIQLAPGSAVAPDEALRVTIRAIRSVSGATRPASAIVRRPR